MRVILGVTGCVGAYKAAEILRLLQQEGFEVEAVMTRHAREFISPLTFEKLSGNKVISDLFGPESPAIEHIAVARRSDLLLVAPATANILGKFARGVADDFLSTLYLSTQTPVILAPAMNVEMWRHPAVAENVRILRERGHGIVEPASGYLACGEVGEGRLAEPELILEAVLGVLGSSDALAGKSVLVTAGPTVEDLDPVRFLSNRSSGKMGYALAGEARRRAARVVLISGPTQLVPPPGVEVVSVRSAAELTEAVFRHFEGVDIAVMAAAVSDFTPARVAEQKIKKRRASLNLELKPTVDILAELGGRKNGRFLVGFAAESENLLEAAREKLRAKNLDLVVANDISRSGQGFEADSNQAVLISASGEIEEFPLLGKDRLAVRIWDRIESLLALPGVPPVLDRS